MQQENADKAAWMIKVRATQKKTSWCRWGYDIGVEERMVSLLEIMSFTTNHYVIGMQLVVIC
jgi:hypothetical protein